MLCTLREQVCGSVIAFVFRTVLHNDLPTDTGEAALSYVASYPIYALVSFPGDVLPEYLLEPDDLWFGSREPLNDAGEGFEDLAP